MGWGERAAGSDEREALPGKPVAWGGPTIATVAVVGLATCLWSPQYPILSSGPAGGCFRRLDFPLHPAYRLAAGRRPYRHVSLCQPHAGL